MSVMIKFVILLFLISNVPQTFSIAPRKKDYCKLGCFQEEHIVCKRRKSCAPEPCCFGTHITRKFREIVLELHNHYRQVVASGGPGSVEGYGAFGMNALSYDLEMEMFAACIANTCPYKGDPMGCLRSDRFQVDAATEWGLHSEHDANETIKKWYDAKKWLHYADMKSRSRYDDDRDNFMQLVSEEAKYVGCARSRYGDYSIFFICIYGPARMRRTFEGSKDLSEVGKKCTKRNKRYPSLCGEIWKTSSEPSWASSAIKCANVSLLNLFALVVIFGWRLGDPMFQIH